MSVKQDSSGRRWVQVEVEVPGTPEEVWEAIATGGGVSSWFVPTEIAEIDGGTPTRVVSHFGPGMDAVATVTAWDPPHRFAAESDGPAPGAPPFATEWIVEARAGGTCVVRVVHSLFATSDDWDDQLEGAESGWPWFFRILRLYLAHFRGEPCSPVHVMALTSLPEAEAWDTMIRGLGLAGVRAGDPASAAAGVPRFGGVVEHSPKDMSEHRLLLRLLEPAPGIASIFAHSMGGQACLMIHFYLYGDRAADVAASIDPVWKSWMNQHFPATEERTLQPETGGHSA